jgi:hypothetical protein
MRRGRQKKNKIETIEKNEIAMKARYSGISLWHGWEQMGKRTHVKSKMIGNLSFSRK